MREPENVAGIAVLGIDYMGFIFYPKSPRFVGENYNAKELIGLTGDIKRTGVFVNASLEYIKSQVEKLALKAVQLHGNETPGLCEQVKDLQVEVIKAFPVGEDFDFELLNGYKSCCDYFLFDTKTKDYGGSGHKFDWDILKGYDNSKPLFLSGGITEDDVDEVLTLNHLNIYAVDINSKFEIKPALKDVMMVERFVNKIKNY